MDFIYCALSAAEYEVKWSGAGHSNSRHNLACELPTNFFTLLSMLGNTKVNQESLNLAIGKLVEMFPHTINIMAQGLFGTDLSHLYPDA